jgi:hypothetical protein
VYAEKTTVLPQVTDKPYHIMLYTSPERDSKAHEKYKICAKCIITYNFCKFVNKLSIFGKNVVNLLSLISLEKK